MSDYSQDRGSTSSPDPKEPSIAPESHSKDFKPSSLTVTSPVDLKVSKAFSFIALISAIVLTMVSFVPFLGALVIVNLWWVPLGSGITGWILSAHQRDNHGIAFSIAGIVGTIISVIISSLLICIVMVGFILLAEHSPASTLPYYYDCTGLPNAGLCVSQ